jgi:Haem-degrading
MNVQRRILSCSISALVTMVVGPAFADCSALPDFSQLRSALVSAITPAAGANGGLGFNMWGTLVANDGTVCAVAFSGSQGTSQWLGSRVISAQKANTANDFSVGHNATPSGSLFPSGLALSTANLFTAVQPGGSLYGLQHSNPVDTAVAYGNRPPSGTAGVSQASFNQGPSAGASFGTPNDPMVGQRVGGVNVFGGGLALYRGGVKVGGVGVSGDTSCTDHMVAWRVRNALGLDQFQGVKGVVDAAHPDNIIFDIKPNTDGTGGTGQAPNGQGGVGQSASGFGHPKCLNNPTDAAVAGLPPVK